MDFCHLGDFYLTNKKAIIGHCYKNRTRCFKKVAHKVAEETRECIGNKIANKIMKPKPVPNEN